MKNIIIAILVSIIVLLSLEPTESNKKNFNVNCGCWMAFDSLQNYIDTAFSFPPEKEKIKKPKKDLD